MMHPPHIPRPHDDATSLQDASGRQIEDIARARLFGDAALITTAAVRSGAAPAATLAATDLERGALVGRYVVLSKLGAGGMGVVYAAYDPELDRKIALKLMHPRLAADAAQSDACEARTRLVRESQALARLNHPHIVAIHDVGEHQGAVWLAMEYVAGETLSTWLQRRRRTWREVLDVMTPAARGLSAAHDAGLVHRDIKPDNIMIGADGRVRVMDLGLARALGGAQDPTRGASPADVAVHNLETLAAQVTRAGALMGTPAYMSPEQLRGEPIHACSDVFSFCVSLWEALMGQRPFAGATLMELAANVLSGAVRPVPRRPSAQQVPGWLRRVCLRGLAVEPERRHPSMQALIDALSNGRARARARKWIVGASAVVALGVSAALFQHHDRAGRIEACEQAGASIHDVWNDEARTQVRAGLVATGLGYALVTADKVTHMLDARAEDWRAHRTRACLLASVEETLASEHLDRAVWCLDERRLEIAAARAELSHADEMDVQRAVAAVASLPAVSACTDRQVLAALPSPPPTSTRPLADRTREKLSEARTLRIVGKYPEGLDLTREALADAEALAWPPLTAAARRLEGQLLASMGALAEAEVASVAAYMESARVQAWEVAGLAALDLISTVGVQQARHSEGKLWAGHAEVASSLAGDPLGLYEAYRFNQLATVHHMEGAYSEAKRLFERAASTFTRSLGPDHPYMAQSLNNIAAVEYELGAYSESRSLYERALALEERALGPEHPDVAQSLNNLANTHLATGAHTAAMALYERALAIQVKVLGPEHPDVATSFSNIAGVHTAMGAYAEAKSSYERALDMQRRALKHDHPALAQTMNNLAAVHEATGAYTEAGELLARSLGLREKVLGADHPRVASSLNSLANIRRAQGDPVEAKALYTRALTILEVKMGPDHAGTADSLAGLGGLALVHGQPTEALALLERAVAIYDAQEGEAEEAPAAHFDLARALVRTGGDRARALAEARKAADGLRGAGVSTMKTRAEIAAFLAEHSFSP